MYIYVCIYICVGIYLSCAIDTTQIIAIDSVNISVRIAEHNPHIEKKYIMIK